MAAHLRTRIGRRTATLAIALAVSLASCGDESPQPPQPATPAQPPAEVLEQILDAALGDDRSRFDQLAIELRTDKDATPTTILTDSTGRVRVSDPVSGTSIVDGDHAFAIVDEETSRPLASREREKLLNLRALAHAAYFAPLHAAKELQRVDPSSIRIDEEWTLRHDGNTPVQLSSNVHGTVHWLELGKPPTLQLPRRIRIDGIGERLVRVLGDRVTFEDAMFQRPEDREPTRPDLVIGGPEFPTKPVFRKIDPCQWLCVDDPGDWPARFATIREHGMTLHKGKQRSAGPPFFFHEGERRFLVIPFVAKEAGTEFSPREDQIVRDADTRTAAVVYAPEGEFDARLSQGRAMLDGLLETYERKPGGPLRIVVDIFNEPKLREGSEAQRARTEKKMDVRLELPIED